MTYRALRFVRKFKRYDILVLAVAATGSHIALFFKLIDAPEKHLAKVDFMAIYNPFLLLRTRFGFFLDNLGFPWPVRNAGELIYYFDGWTSWFPYKDFLLYFVMPTLIGAYYFYKYFSFLACYVFELSDSEFIGVASSCFIYFSAIFIYVFAFGWNMPLYWGISGVALALHFGTRLLNEERIISMSLLGFFVGAVLAGTLIHFLILLAAMLFSSKCMKKYIFLIGIMFIANCYYVLPELYKTFNLGFDYYQGIDPIADALVRFRSLCAYTRFSLFPDGQSHYFQVGHAGLLLITLLSFVGAFATFYSKKSIKVIYVVFVSLFILLSASSFFQLSLHNLMIHLPFFGGMFRDPAKLAVLAIIPSAFFSSVAVTKFGKAWRVVVMFLVIGNFIYLVDTLHHKHLDINGFDLPKSYQEAYSTIEKYTKPTERVLLLQFPYWFHFYHWNSGTQTQNLFRTGLRRAAILDETIPPRTLPPEMWKQISLFQEPNADCQELLKSAYQLGIGAIALQKDILNIDGKPYTVKEIQQNFQRCSLKQVYSSDQVDVYLLKSRPLMEFCNSIDGLCIEAPFRTRLFGTVAEFSVPSHFDRFHLNYRFIDHSFGLISPLFPRFVYGKPGSPSGMGYQWLNLKANKNGELYYLVNTLTLISLLSYGVTILSFVALSGCVFVGFLRRQSGLRQFNKKTY